MQINLGAQPFAAIETEALVSYVFEETDPIHGRIGEIDHLAGGLLRKLAKRANSLARIWSSLWYTPRQD